MHSLHTIIPYCSLSLMALSWPWLHALHTVDTWCYIQLTGTRHQSSVMVMMMMIRHNKRNPAHYYHES